MQEKQKTPQVNNKKLPGWAGWLCGWAAVLAASAGLVYYWRVIFSLSALPAVPFTLGVMGIFSLLYGAVFLLCRFLKGDEKICLKAALLVFALGLLFCFATAPLQAPDEQGYFLRAVSVSMGRFAYDYEEEYPDDVHLLVQEFGPALNHRVTYQGAQLAPDAFVRYRAALNAGETAEEKATSPIVYLNIPFLLPGLFMAVARLFGFSALGMLYAGRLANVVLYAALAYFTFKNCRRYRGVFFAVLLLPLCLFLAGSLSYDGLMLALCFYMASILCKDRVENSDMILFAAALLVATYIKPVNVLFAALLFLVPKGRWNVRVKRPVLAGIFLAAALLFWTVLGTVVDGGLLRLNWEGVELPRGSGEEASVAGQIGFILSNPLAFVARVLQSVYEADGFLFDLGRFGWMDLVVPLVGGLSVLSLCLASVLAVRQKEDDAAKRALWLVLLALLYGAAVLGAMYVGDTDVGSIRVTGQQPRYFLPAFLLLFVAASMLLGRAVRPRISPTESLAKTEDITLWVAAGLALLAAVLLFQNYFIGQWIPKAEGGWKLVNLFGAIDN